jgi:hypothetical protein
VLVDAPKGPNKATRANKSLLWILKVQKISVVNAADEFSMHSDSDFGALHATKDFQPNTRRLDLLTANLILGQPLNISST